MNLDAALQEAVRQALLQQLPAVLAELRAELRLVPVKRAPVSYRAILEGERLGELVVYRKGNASFVDEAELYDWIKRTGAQQPKPAPAPGDEVDALITDQDQNRKRRPRAA